MPAPKKIIPLLRYFSKNLLVVAGIVLIWRGVWTLLDLLDEVVGLEWRWATALAGIVAGLLVLYLPDRDLDEIKKL